MDLTDLASRVATEVKALADDVRAASQSEFVSEAVAYIPSLGPFLNAVSKNAATASKLADLVPHLERIAVLASNLAWHSATVEELEKRDADRGMSSD
jgi:hypothetical protein